MTEMMELANKEVKAIVINMSKELKKNMSTMRKEMETAKKIEMDLWDFKNIILKLKIQ